MSEHLQIEVEDGICRIRLCRPEALNALDEDTGRALVAGLHDAGADEAVRVVVITGEGRAFCAGVELRGEDPVQHLDERAVQGAAAIARAVTGLATPVVVGVHGVAAGVGASLCFAADLAVAAESASFLLAFSRIGLMPDAGATRAVAASAGRARAMRMALLGEALPAHEAFRAGLVSHVASDEDYQEVLAGVVGQVASGPPLAHTAVKRAVNAATLGDLEEVLSRESRGQLALLGSRDAAEGMRAFVERRRPRFSGA